VFCDDLEHRTSKYLNNHLEQDHQGVKGRLRPCSHSSAEGRSGNVRRSLADPSGAYSG
jgi:transposase-like protein